MNNTPNNTLIDVVGMRFGKLVVIERDTNTNGGQARWKCLCDCGRYKTVIGSSLRNGTTKSCGCIKKSLIGQTTKTHGASHTRLYSKWHGMKQRCYNPHNVQYRNYGGRGIYVCEQWNNSFSAFRDWAYANGYNPNLDGRTEQSLDRIDNDGPYSPNNCRWVTPRQNTRNRRKTRYITIDGITKCAAEWRDELGVPDQEIRWRLQKGDDVFIQYYKQKKAEKIKMFQK